MTRTPSTIAAGIAAFAALAPAAVAMPTDGPIKTSSVPGLTKSQRQDLRSPDARDAATRQRHLAAGHVSLPAVQPSRIVHVAASNGFDVTDAALGAGGAFAALVVATAGGVALRRRTARGLAA
jgi:hypothetical protein